MNAHLLVAYLVRHVGKVNAYIEPLVDEFQTISWFVLCEYAFTIHVIPYGEHREYENLNSEIAYSS